MKVAIVNCFDTFLERQTALLHFFQSRGDQVTAFISDFRHVQKAYRAEAPEGFTMLHAAAYKKFVGSANAIPQPICPLGLYCARTGELGSDLGNRTAEFTGQTVCPLSDGTSSDKIGAGCQ